MEELYYFVRGPLLWISFIVFAGGIVFRVIQFFDLTTKKEAGFFPPRKNQVERYGKCSDLENKLNRLLTIKNSLLGFHPFVTILTTFFHVLIFVLPVFLPAHNILIYQSWSFSLWSFSEATGDKLTIVFLGLALFFLFRRIFVRKVRAITSFSDYFILLITVAPFLTGFICYRQWFDYQTVLIIHILCGELMLMAVAFTKIGHMVFFFLARFFVGSEYSLGRGRRTWN